MPVIASIVFLFYQSEKSLRENTPLEKFSQTMTNAVKSTLSSLTICGASTYVVYAIASGFISELKPLNSVEDAESNGDNAAEWLIAGLVMFIVLIIWGFMQFPIWRETINHFFRVEQAWDARRNRLARAREEEEEELSVLASKMEEV